MKKRVKRFGISCIVLLLIGCCSCLGTGTKEYSKAGFSIRLPGSFYESEMASVTCYYTSQKAIVSATKEEFSLLAQVGLSSQSSLEDYAKVVLLNNKLPEDSARSADSGEYLYFTYERTANGKDFFYTAVLLKGTDAFWICNFACETSNKKSYSKTFLEWAETIRVD